MEFTFQDEEPKKDFTDESEHIDDDILKNLCRKCGQWIVTVRFNASYVLLTLLVIVLLYNIFVRHNMPWGLGENFDCSNC